MDAPIYEAYEDPITDNEYFRHLSSEISFMVGENGGIAAASEFLQKEIHGLFETLSFRVNHAEQMMAEAHLALDTHAYGMDEHTYQELASCLDDHPYDHAGVDQVRTRLVHTKKKIQAAALREAAKYLRDFRSEYGAAEYLDSLADQQEAPDA